MEIRKMKTENEIEEKIRFYRMLYDEGDDISIDRQIRLLKWVLDYERFK
jgi:hypothetical protein